MNSRRNNRPGQTTAPNLINSYYTMSFSGKFTFVKKRWKFHNRSLTFLAYEYTLIYTRNDMQTFSRTIAHIDADCFFASVELISRPELKGKPMFVCNRTDNRGIVLAATYEARPFGIRAGTPVFKAKKLCPQGIILQSNFDKYEMTSNRMMAIFRQFSPDVEICSIDEAYVDLTGLRMLYRTDYAGIGELIQKKIFAELGITISIGIASNKLLAKIASDFKKPSGLTAVTGFNRKEFLKKIPIENIPGIGKNTAALLTKYGFKTAHDISISEKIPLLLGKRGEYLSKELNGECVSKIKNTKSLPLSLSNTRTFPDFTYDKNYIYTFITKTFLSNL